MKKCIAFMGVVLLSSPAFALFTNAGFETGDWTGWTLEFGQRDIMTKNITWGVLDHGKYLVMDDTATMAGQILDINPYYGNYMARINDVYGMSHATRLSQTGQVTQQNIDSGARLYITWGAVLTESVIPHVGDSLPYFGITVTAGTDTWTLTADSSDTTGWTCAGVLIDNPLWYKSDTLSVDLSSYPVGTDVSVELFVSDCGGGKHGAYAFLDGRVTSIIPVPGAFLLGMLGTVTVSWVKRRKLI